MTLGLIMLLIFAQNTNSIQSGGRQLTAVAIIGRQQCKKRRIDENLSLINWRRLASFRLLFHLKTARSRDGIRLGSRRWRRRRRLWLLAEGNLESRWRCHGLAAIVESNLRRIEQKRLIRHGLFEFVVDIARVRRRRCRQWGRDGE